MADNRSPHPSLRRYPPELRERAVRMVLETIEQTGERFGVITRVARQLGIGSDAGGYATLISDTGSGRCWAVRGGGASLIAETLGFGQAFLSSGTRRLTSASSSARLPNNG